MSSISRLKKQEQLPAIDPKALLSGVLTVAILSIILSLVMASVIYFSELTEELTMMVLSYTGFAVIAVGGAIASRKARTRGFVHGGMVGVIYILITAALSVLIFPSALVLSEVFLKVLLGFTIGALGGVIGINL